MIKLTLIRVALISGMILSGLMTGTGLAEGFGDQEPPFGQQREYEPYDRTDPREPWPPRTYDTRRPSYGEDPFDRPDPRQERPGWPGEPGYESTGCCVPPGPDGLYCCDTRDCGWFACDDHFMPEKVYR